MTTTKREVPEVTITVSKPFHVVGFQGGGRYGASLSTKCNYTTSVLGHDISKNSKAEIMDRVRVLYYRETGSNRVRFTFAPEQEG